MFYQHILIPRVSKSNAWSGAFGVCYWLKKSPLASYLDVLGQDSWSHFLTLLGGTFGVTGLLGESPVLFDPPVMFKV